MKQEPVWFESVKDKKRFDSLKQDISVDVAVIGGGIVGVSSAYFISKKGLKAMKKGKEFTL